MAKLASPYRHFPAYGVGYSDTVTMLKIAAAETIDISWTYYVGNNGSEARNGDQYFLLSQNLGSGRQKKLVEYAPGEGIVNDFFEEEFGVSSQVLMPSRRQDQGLVPSTVVSVGAEPTITMYDSPVNYGVPKYYKLRLPGPLAGTTAQGGLNQPLLEWWEEVARREAFSYLGVEFAYYQLDKQMNLDRQILPRVDEPAVQNFWLSGFGHQTHKFQNLIRVLWEEDR